MMPKPEFKLACDCGHSEFYITHLLNDDSIEIRCADCDTVIGHVRTYAIEWSKGLTKDAISSD